MLLKPNIKLKKITDITPGLLKSRNIRGLILDVDNTLSTHHGQKLTDGLESWPLCGKTELPLLFFQTQRKKG